METNTIFVQDLYKQFDGFMLDHVSFQVPKGRIVGFIGENGSGKSTTIHLILDELKRDSGQIQIFGKENTISSVKEDIGVVFEECNFRNVFHTSDIEKILSGIYKSWDSSLYRQYLKKFKIPERKQIGSFSSRINSLPKNPLWNITYSTTEAGLCDIRAIGLVQNYYPFDYRNDRT